MPAFKSLYDVLNVAPEAEGVVIEAAYRALIKKYHPDQAADGPVPKDAAEINEAWAVLKDPARRAEYDHRVWSRQQAMRLAQLQVGEGKRSRSAVWGGWLVAALLGCALAAVAAAKSFAPPPVREAPTEVAGSDPVAALAAKASAAAAEMDRNVLPSSDSVIARVDARANASKPQRVRATPRYSGQSRYVAPLRARPRRAAQRSAAPAAKPRRESDFLEREGYIY